MTDIYEEKPRTMIKFDAALGKALTFNRDDLQANRVGGITDRQRTAIYGRMLAALGQGIGIGLIGLVILLLALISRPTESSLSASTTTGLPVIAAAILFVAGLVLGGLSLRYAYQLRQDLKAGKLASIKGKVNTTRSLPGYQVHVGGMSFRINQAASAHFQSGGQVMLYYAPHSKWILAVEAI